jgi:hypothetical protein
MASFAKASLRSEQPWGSLVLRARVCVVCVCVWVGGWVGGWVGVGGWVVGGEGGGCGWVWVGG